MIKKGRHKVLQKNSCVLGMIVLVPKHYLDRSYMAWFIMIVLRTVKIAPTIY